MLLPASKVTAGTKYWVVIVSFSGMLKCRDNVGSTALTSETSKSTALTSLPSTYLVDRYRVCHRPAVGLWGGVLNG